MNFAKILFFGCVVLFVGALAGAAERPNIVWIVSEDNSKHYLELFDPTGAPTPNIAKMAEEGLLFEHAFSNSPVCSVARTTLMTSVYAPRIGTQFHRRLTKVTLPEGWQMFPAYLRMAGYYTTNNSKTDYNTNNDISNVWNESSNKASWKKRPKSEMPFFHMQSHGNSHEGSLHFPAVAMREGPTTKPADMTLAPYHPDTKTFRYTYARYHDRIRQIDGIVGNTVQQLTDAGVLEDTFIFYFGDHGGVLPGSKGYVKEAGLHVPLVVRVPKNWQHLAPAQRGTKIDGFVEFVDFGPTVLKLAGVELPEYVDGKSFMGDGTKLAELNARDEAFGYADRFDEKYDMVRTLRKGKWKYHRNYQGYYPDGLQNNYRYRMLAYQEWRALAQEGQVNDVQRQFYEAKPGHALYDLETDPHETRNLAGHVMYRKTLLEMQARLRKRVVALPDLSFYPESLLVDEAVAAPQEFGRDHASEIAMLAGKADLCLLPIDQATRPLQRGLADENQWIRYWSATACAVLGDDAKRLVADAKPLLSDDNLLVRVRAAEFIGRVGGEDPRPALYSVLRESKSPATTLIALNAVVFLRDYHDFEFEFDKRELGAANSEVGRRVQYLGW